jgi:hypothetical protein
MVNLRSLNAQQRCRRRLSALALHTAFIKRFAQRACPTERPRVRRRCAAPPCSRSSSLLRRLRVCFGENRAETPGRSISAVAPHANSGDDVWRRQLPCPPAGSRNGVTRGTLHGSFFCAGLVLRSGAGSIASAHRVCRARKVCFARVSTRYESPSLRPTVGYAASQSTILFCVRQGVRGSRFANSVLLID